MFARSVIHPVVEVVENTAKVKFSLFVSCCSVCITGVVAAPVFARICRKSTKAAIFLDSKWPKNLKFPLVFLLHVHILHINKRGTQGKPVANRKGER